MDENELRLQKSVHNNAYEFISQALLLEETDGDVHEALHMYKQGIAQLEQGTALTVQDVRSRKLQVKMRKNLTLAKERVKVLDAVIRNKDKPESNTSRNHGKQRKEVPLPSQNTTSSQPSKGHTPALMPRNSHSNRNLMNGACSKNSRGSASSAGPPNLKRNDQQYLDVIKSEILDSSPPVKFSDIAGQEVAKQALREIILLPSVRPDLFTGLRAPAKGLLLFGPPGNGKTLLAKAVASECCNTFFSISASSLTSKWVGEGEKLVKALFTVARQLQPSIIFIDEVDSLLSSRKEDEQEASRRIKTEFLVQFDGVGSCAEDRVLVMGATNRPRELDEAVLRRFSKRIYVRLPDATDREALLRGLLLSQSNPLHDSELLQLVRLTEGYSASDLTNLTKDAALGPIREIPISRISTISKRDIRQITMKDFLQSMQKIRRCISPNSLQAFEQWNQQFGDTSST